MNALSLKDAHKVATVKPAIPQQQQQRGCPRVQEIKDLQARQQQPQM